MARHAKRTDANHAEIRDGLRKIGWEVIDTSQIGWGYPDLTVKIGELLPVMLEVKDPNKPKSGQALTEKEVEFFAMFSPICYVVTTIDEAVTAIGKAKVMQSSWE